MKRLLLALLFVVFALHADATITRVQAGSQFVTASANTDTMAVSALTAGNYLIVGVTSTVVRETTVSGATVGNLVGGSVSRGWDATGLIYTEILFYRIAVGGDTSLTIALIDGVNSVYVAVAAEYSAKNLTVDVETPKTGGPNASPTFGPTATTNYANELQICVYGSRFATSSEQTAWATSPTNSFTSVIQTSSTINTANTDRTAALFEKFATSTGTVSVTITNANGSQRYAACIATFREIPQVTTSTSND